MFDNIGDAAEKLATGVSRRHLLSVLGRWAGATALAMAGVLSTTGTARATEHYTCCCYSSFPSPGCACCVCVAAGTACPGSGGCPGSVGLYNTFPVNNCGKCRCP
jgi:hypothetical protein